MLVNSINLLLWFVRVARVWPEVCLMTIRSKEFAMYVPRPARRKITQTQAEAILDAYATTEREATERNRGQEYRHTYHDLTPAQREAAALLFEEWRYLVFSIDGLGK
jgi:hypothetical protein